jgi:starch phosphorylase
MSNPNEFMSPGMGNNTLKRNMSTTGLPVLIDAPAEKLFGLKKTFLPNDQETIQKNIIDHVEYTLARTKHNFDSFAAYQATAYSVRDRLIEKWNETQQYYTEKDAKRIYYLSLEFLMGRSLQNTVSNMGIKDDFGTALMELGYSLEDAYEQEKDAALGNGGLGRLAACFMDSLASLNYPAWGYGLRYNYGMFEQGIYDGYQTELPDYWLVNGNPWEIERIDVQYMIRFYGQVVTTTLYDGTQKFSWEGGEIVRAVAYDNPVPGYKTGNINNIRLWSSKPHKEFDLQMFNEGNYFSAVEFKQRSENITSVLYPNDNTYVGKELRLKQQYFFVAATLCDVIRRYKKTHPDNWTLFPEKVAIQLNDTHPSIAIVELLRKLIDEEGLKWDDAYPIVEKTFAYTNHTILPEALEVWPLSLMENLLPRHVQIIYIINHLFLTKVVEKRWPNDTARMNKLSIIEEGYEKKVRMAHLAIVVSHCVNGVAKMHTEIVKHVTFADFYALWPDKFQNKTNGVTPRRWVLQTNPSLSEVITKRLGTDNWTTDLELLSGLNKYVDDADLHKEILAAKRINKVRLANYIRDVCGVEVPVDALFDVHIKRIHEYKRQLLNILHVIHRYLAIKALTPRERIETVVPRVVIFAGKAAPGYAMAKRHIKLINSVADVVNSDPDIGRFLKVVFIPNYNVSSAQLIVPAADINQQISTAGTEASGTSNMKFAINGSLIIGTMDGANVEIAECIGEQNMFIFGLRAEAVDKTRAAMSAGEIKTDPRLKAVFEAIESGVFGSPEALVPVIQALFNNDRYLVIADFPSYADAQKEVDRVWLDQDEWVRRSIRNTAGNGMFSSDRSIHQYAKEIWNATPCPVPVSDKRLY